MNIGKSRSPKDWMRDLSSLATSKRVSGLNRLLELTSRIRNEGFLIAFPRLLELFRDRIVPSWQHLYWMPLDEFIEWHPEQGGLELRVVRNLIELGKQDRHALERSVGASAIPIFERRLSEGCELHALFSKGQVAGTLFIVFGHHRTFQHVVLTDRDVMVLDARIDPEFRGLGLYRLFLLLAMSHLKRSRVERMFIACSALNQRSIQCFAKIGYRFLLRFRLIKGKYQFDKRPL